MEKIYKKIINILESRTFFWVVVALFVAQATWLAVSASYPMIYDEYYHLGFIDIYSKHILPFINSQTPEQIVTHGDITRITSYLFHYLLSFPYRIVGFFTDSFYIKIVSLRLINVAFVALGLIFFRKLLLQARLKKSIIHIALFCVVMLPIFPYVAAHVNYDNLLFLLTPIFLIFGLQNLRSKKSDATALISFVSVGLIACLVKYTFLPILVVGFAFVGVRLIKSEKNKLLSGIVQDFLSKRTITKVLLATLLLVSIGLFSERYIVNTIVYRDFQPACKTLHEEEICSNQPVIRRNNKAKESFAKDPVPIADLVEYTRTLWVPSMVVGSLQVRANIGAQDNFNNTVKTVKSGEWSRPLPILEMSLWVFVLLSIVFLAYSWRELKKMPYFWFFVSIFLVYLFTVWIYTNYLGYRRSGHAFAMQPRYFIILLPIVIAYIVQGASIAVRNTKVKLIAVFVVLAIFTQGGGATTYIVRSDEDWYWQRRTIIDANMKLKHTIAPFIKEK